MGGDKRPLILDVDGTFLRTDLLFETFWLGLGRAPFPTLRAALSHFRDPAALKAALADIVQPRLDLMPVSPEMDRVLKDAREEGRPIGLASASDSRLIAGLSDHHGFGEPPLGTADGRNLKGPQKAEALVERYGEGGFDYAGNEAADLTVWRSGKEAIVIGDPASAEVLRGEGRSVTELDGGWAPRDLWKAFRPHQWVKNVLLFLPAIAAHDFAFSTFLLVLLGIVAFSAAASSIYIVNDLLDLEADRLHPTKCKRPFASGKVPIRIGMMASAVCGLVALGIGAALGGGFFGVIVLYMILSLSYSLRLKRMRWVDIAILATLYTLRVVAGAAASGVDASIFMLVFIFPVFLTLGCVKRLTELALATSDERLPGRGYGRTDRGDLLNMAGIGTVGALVIFLLYSFSEQAQALYPTRWLLWVALIPIAAWLIRMVKLGWEGRQDYDPIVFALRDRMGMGILLITLSLMFYAAGLWAEWFGL